MKYSQQIILKNGAYNLRRDRILPELTFKIHEKPLDSLLKGR